MKDQDQINTSFEITTGEMDTGEVISAGGKHKLATIMFSDICGFTRMMGKDEKKTLQIVEQNKHIHLEEFHNNNGVLIKELGDGLLASFESTYDAVRCAKKIMEEVNTAQYNLHIGLHLGDVIFTHEDIFGDGVNIASRINASASNGEIIVSEEVWNTIKNHPEFRSVFLGRRWLKNVDHPVRLYRILLDNEKKRIPVKAIYRSYSKRINYGIAGILLLSILIIVFNRSNSHFKFLETPKTIAILPFDNRTDQTEFQYLSNSLAEDVISQLFNLSSYTVVSSRSSFQYKDSEKSIQQIAKELKADILLVGNFTINNNKIDVKVEVVDGKQNQIINFTSINSNLNEIRSVADKIGEALFETLNIDTEKQEKNTRKTSASINLEAYKLNAMGRSSMSDNTGQNISEIIQYFKAAIAIDSTFADPYIGMAETYIFDANRGYISPAEAANKAREYALIAESLNPGTGEVSALMAIIHYLDGDYKKAVPYFERSLQKSPNYYLTYHYYAFNMEMLGDFEKALELLAKASVIDPLNTFTDIYIAVNYLFQGKLNEAQKMVDRMLSIDPDHAMSLWMKAILLNQEKKYQEALEVLNKRDLGRETNFIVGYTYARLGEKEKAMMVLNNILKSSETKYVPPTQVAIIYCGLNEKEKAMEQVKEAMLAHDIWIGYLKFTSFSDPIKDDPSYISMMDSFRIK